MSWLIESTTQDGRTFRPSDWVDRVSGILAKFGPDHRLRYGPVRPCYVKGKKCLLVKKSLEQEDPVSFSYVKEFVRANGLQMSDFSAASCEPETGKNTNQNTDQLEAVA